MLTVVISGLDKDKWFTAIYMHISIVLLQTGLVFRSRLVWYAEL